MILLLILIRVLFSSNSEKYIRKGEDQAELLQKIAMNLKISINKMLSLRKRVISVEEERPF